MNTRDQPDGLISSLASEELARRPSRSADHASESAALVALSRQFASAPSTILDGLSEAALDLCNAQSAGFSLLADDGRRFEWAAIAGEWARHVGGGTPRDFGPCGMVLDRDAPLLFWNPERVFPYLADATPCIAEGLLLPFYLGGRPVGTIWVIHHEADRHFDAEDLRIMKSLATFASAGYQAHRDAEHRFRATLEAMPAAVYTTDAEGRITHFNRAVVAMAGQTPQVGRDLWCPWWKLYDLDGHEIEPPDGPMGRAIRSGREIRESEFVIERPGGSRACVIAHATPLVTSAGAVTGWINMVIDITQRKAAEARLREDDRRKDEFIAMLAHELRNPLAPITNGLELIRMAKGDLAMIDECRGLIDRQVRQLVRLVDDLLDVSRITRNKVELRKSRVELAEVVQTAVETSRPLIENGRHALEIALPGEPIWLHADAVRVAQAVSNVLNNAAKYSEPGGRIRISAEASESQALVRIRDYGIGIPPDKLESVLEMFVQLDGALGRGHGGLGIGLSLAQQLVQLHGGRIEVSSGGPGSGTEVILFLPRADPSPIKAMPADPDAGRVRQAGIRRIVVADDNRDAAESLATLLRHEGHEVALAHDGAEAVALANAFRPDVVLLDIGMPELDGYEAAQRIRQNFGDRSVLLVAITGWGHESDRRRAFDAGFDLHLVKPVTPGLLKRILEGLDDRAERLEPSQISPA